MKRLLTLLLTLCLLLPLAACSRGEVTPETLGTAKKDLSALSDEELYAYGLEKLSQLLNYAVKTEITGGEETSTVTLTRLRTGYDSFDLSRRGENEEITYVGGVAFVKTALGAYTAETAPRIMREFLDGQCYPLLGLDAEAITLTAREGLSLRFESENEALLARFAALDETGAFQPASLTGALTLNEEGVLLEETIRITGQSGDEPRSYTLSTEMVKFRSPENTVSPLTEEEAAAYVAVEDIRTPAMLHEARESLLTEEVLALTVVQSAAHQSEGLRLNLGRETNLYRKSLSSYLSHQTLLSRTEGDALPQETSRLLQLRLEKGVLTTVEHDLFSAEELSRSEAENREVLWQKELAALLPDAKELTSLELEKEGAAYHVAFTANASFAAAVAELAAESLGIAAPEGAELEGTLTLDVETGAVLALAYSYKAGALTGSFTLTPETEEFTVPSLQTPTPTTGTEEGEHDPAC